ncbi:MAG TPA: hypothetical protein VFI91_01540 [Longimicrobiaceae bacterium]|nr:hypothetical protein [Longimicrobiaceae bacterium]
MDRQLALYLDEVRPALDSAALCAEEEQAVAGALRWGRANARQITTIAGEVGFGGRKVQELIEHLIHAHQWPIGTAMSPPFGAYLIDSASDLEATEALLRRRGISSLARAAALRRMSLSQYLRSVQTDLMEPI